MRRRGLRDEHVYTRWLLERDDPAALRVHAREDALDRSVLARGVEALEDQQKAPLGFGVEPVVKDRELVDQLRQLFLSLGLSGQAGVIVRLSFAQARRRARLDHQLREHSATLYGRAQDAKPRRCAIGRNLL
jgi:hypothetical protein